MDRRYFPNPYSEVGPSYTLTPHKVNEGRVLSCVKHILQGLQPCEANASGGLYVGTAGVAYAFYHVAMNPHFKQHQDKLLSDAKTYVESALAFYAKQTTGSCDEVGFLLGAGGVYVVAALIYQAIGDHTESMKYVGKYKDLASRCVPMDFLPFGGDEMFVGRAGYLMGVVILQRQLNREIMSEDEIGKIFHSIIQSGESLKSQLDIGAELPLIFHYYNTMYLGSGHGMAGILHVLMSFPRQLTSDPRAADMIRRSVDYLLSQCVERDGVVNLPTSLESCHSGGRCLVHWCHGASGVIHTLARAHLVFNQNRKYLEGCIKLGETIWKRGLLKKGPGICHGVAGSGFAFLLLHRLTGEMKYLGRADRFAGFMFTEVFSSGSRSPDSPHSLFEGLAGTLCYLVDLMQPDQSQFPLCPVFIG